MKMREAVQAAKAHLLDAFSEEDGVINLGLEEIEFVERDGVWNVTLGFSRPWSEDRGGMGGFLGQLNGPRRDYRVVRVRDTDGVATSIRLRELAA